MATKQTLGNGEYRVQVQHKPKRAEDGTISIGNVGELTTTRIFGPATLMKLLMRPVLYQPQVLAQSSVALF